MTGTMIDITTDPHFGELFHRAYRIIDSVAAFGVPEMSWRLGGGTALAIYLQHRKSDDLDIFITDVQYLGYLTPRKNPIAEQETDQYDEQSNFVKFHFGEYQIDFIVAPILTDVPPVTQEIFGRSITLDPPAEIFAKKIMYRASSLTGRDLFDIVNATHRIPELQTQLAEFLNQRRDLIEARLTLNHKQIKTNFVFLHQTYGGLPFDQALIELQNIFQKSATLRTRQ